MIAQQQLTVRQFITVEADFLAGFRAERIARHAAGLRIFQQNAVIGFRKELNMSGINRHELCLLGFRVIETVADGVITAVQM